MVEWFISSAVLIVLVLALRRALGKKLSAAARYALWLVVLARLLVPAQLVSLPVYSTEGERPVAAVSPSVPVATLPEAPGESNMPAVTPTTPITTPGASSIQPAVSEPAAAPWTPEEWLTAAWLCGAGVLGAVIVTSNLRFFLALRRRRTRLKGADCALPVYTAEGLESPCLVGLVHPAVYLAPEDAENPQRLRHILAHEQAHWRGGDHIWAVGRAAALCLHWFDPLVWVAAAVSKRDAELACDARTLKALGDGERAAYGETLLSLVTARPTPRALLSCSTAMSGGKKTLRERIEAIAKKPQTRRAALFLAAAVVILAAVLAFGQERSEYDAFLTELDRATQIGYLPEIRNITDPTCPEDSLPQIKALLSKIERTAEGSWPLTDEVEQNALFLGERQYGFQSDGEGALLYRVEQTGEQTQCFLVGRYRAESDVRGELERWIGRAAQMEAKLFLQQVERAEEIAVVPAPTSSVGYPALTGDALQSARDELSAVEAADERDEPEGEKSLFMRPGVVVGEEFYRFYPNSANGETLLYRQSSPDTAVNDSDYALVGKYSGNIINRLMTLASAQHVERFGFLPNSELRSSQTATVSSGKNTWTVEDAERDDVLGSLREIGADAALYREVTGEDTLALYPSFDCGMTVELVGGGHISLWPLIEAGDGAVLLRYVSDTENRAFLLSSAGIIRMNILRIAGMGDTTREQFNAIYDRVSVPYGDSDDLTVVARSLVGRITAAWMEMPSDTAWKPLDVKIGDVSVTDIYFGEEENFLANVTLWLKFDGNYSANFWQAGAGLIAQDADGYWLWGGEMLVELRDGAWVTDDGIGGAGGSVNVGFRLGTASCEQLVKAFTLTSGFTHDYLIPSYFCNLPESELAKLLTVLDGYRETQASDFLRAVADHLAQYPSYHDLTAEKLQDLTAKGDRVIPILAAEPFQTVAAGNGRFALYDYGKREWALVLETGDVRKIVTTFYRDLSDPDDSIAIFAMDDLLGFPGVAVQTDTADGYHKSYLYYAWTDSGVQYVGYSFGFYDNPHEATTAVDLDGDGRSELVVPLECEVDGEEYVLAFRWNGTSAEMGTPDWTKAGVDLSNAPQMQESYDSESGRLTLIYDADGETKTAMLWLRSASFHWGSFLE